MLKKIEQAGRIHFLLFFSFFFFSIKKAHETLKQNLAKFNSFPTIIKIKKSYIQTTIFFIFKNKQ